MKEYVMNENEFKSLIKGRTHWTIEREPIRITNVSGGGAMQTGEHRLILVVSGLSKDDTKHVIAMKVDFGFRHWNTPEYKDLTTTAIEYAKKNFPKATKGAFE